jgi:Tol biopolymer transport system component
MRRSAASFLVATLVLFGSIPLRPAISATFPGANGRVAFVYDPNGIPRLATARPDGHDVRVLVPNPSGFSELFVSEPQVSPDGGRILILRDPFPSSGSPHLLLVNMDGTGISDLGQLPERSSPSWSPDGEILWADATGAYEAPADQLGSKVSLFADASQPVWSPDGSKIAFTRSTDNVSHIWVADPDGGAQTQLTFAVKNGAGQSDPAWSPDSSQIVYQAGAVAQSSVHVGSVNRDGSMEMELTSKGMNSEPVWSPDGTKIAFLSSRASGMWTMDPEGSGQVRVSRIAGFGEFDWQSQQVTLAASESVLTFGSKLTLSAHVVAAPASGTVRFLRILAGSTKRSLIATESVDGNGNAAITISPQVSARYVLRWSGDVDHPLGGWSAPRDVRVKVRIRGEMRGGYATRNGVRLYHFTLACPRQGRSCPLSAFAVAPNHAGKRLLVTLQLRRSGGSWRTISSRRWRLNKKSTLGIIWIYSDAAVIGRSFRTRAKFISDRDHASASTAWLGFRVTD